MKDVEPESEINLAYEQKNDREFNGELEPQHCECLGSCYNLLDPLSFLHHKIPHGGIRVYNKSVLLYGRWTLTCLGEELGKGCGGKIREV